MCGIIGIVSNEDVFSKILSCLKLLEYRGYDSVGIATINQNKINIVKKYGSVSSLDKDFLHGNIGIGHTRWATNGSPSKKNAHPHISYDNTVAIVHNGIIENYKELKNQYLKDVILKSQTDSEIIAHLLARQYNGNTLETISKVAKLLKGSYAVACIFKDQPNTIYAFKNKSPLIVANNKNTYICSDVNAIPSKSYFYLEDNEIVEASKNQIKFYDNDLKQLNKNICLKEELIETKNNNKSIMESEIDEIPEAIGRLKEYYDTFNFKEIKDVFLKCKGIEIIACGSAYHSALCGEIYLENALDVPIHSYIASEFKYRNKSIRKDNLYIFVSQSGETADTIYCANKVKSQGAYTLAITNVPNSTLFNICQIILPLKAGPERAVASTKAYICQVLTFKIIADIILDKNPTLFLDGLSEIIKKYEYKKNMKKFVDQVLSFNKVIFIGRLLDYATAMEASLKLKEITYLNSIALASGELKHGTLALVDCKTLVFSFQTSYTLLEKEEITVKEIESRKGKVIKVSNFNGDIFLPDCREEYMPILSIIPFEYLALKACEKKGYNPDKPRNLAKCVTVE